MMSFAQGIQMKMTKWIGCFLVAASWAGVVTAGDGTAEAESLASSYREAAGRITGAAMTDEQGMERLKYLSTVIGHRLSGSESLEKAIEWAHEEMKKDGLENVALQPVMVPHWVRGHEEAHIVGPVPRQMNILGLGMSVGTPAEGVTAEVVTVESFDELDALGREAIEGKIVAYSVPWVGYGGTVQYRSKGPSRAAAYGAVAVLVRSATGASLSTPHTGALSYDDAQPKIPAAAMTVEDAEWLKRMKSLGQTVTVRLKMEAKMLEDAQSYNVMAEIKGSELPEEIVVMGGHYDSWDVGDGSHDDGAACIAAWQALNLIHELGLRPKRTLRVVLWTNEENGIRGGKEYRAALGDDVRRHVAAIEMDGGAERPLGYGFGLAGAGMEGDDPVYEGAYRKLVQIGSLLHGIGAGQIFRGGGGADIGPLMKDGVPGLGLRTTGKHYFDWHHTHADTYDKIDPQSFQKAVATLGVMGFVLADMPGHLVPLDYVPEVAEDEGP